MVTNLFDTVFSIFEIGRITTFGVCGSFGSLTSLIATKDVRREGDDVVDKGNAGLGAFLLKIKTPVPQHANRITNPKIAERPIAAFSPSPIGAVM
jgi:hypothetical protein